MKEIVSTIMTFVSLGYGMQRSLDQKQTDQAKNYRVEELVVISTAFDYEGDIPMKYTCEGENIQPPLAVHNIPAGTKTLAVVMYDEDAPDGHLTHWVAFNIEPKRMIEENSLPGTTGKNGKGSNIYFGPCPTIGTHYYHFQVYALNTELGLDHTADEKSLKRAMAKHIIGYGELVGRYKKNSMADN